MKLGHLQGRLGEGGYEKHLEKGELLEVMELLQVIELGQTQQGCGNGGHQSTKK